MNFIEYFGNWIDWNKKKTQHTACRNHYKELNWNKKNWIEESKKFNWREEEHEMKTKDKKSLNHQRKIELDRRRRSRIEEKKITNRWEEENQVESNNRSRWSGNQLGRKSVKKMKKEKKHEER